MRQAFRLTVFAVPFAMVSAGKSPHDRNPRVYAARSSLVSMTNISKRRARELITGIIDKECFVHVENPDLLGNGFCDPKYNNAACGYDRGDCCPSTCKFNMIARRAPNDCSGPMFCTDPNAPESFKFPDCNVGDRRFIGDGFCDSDGGYNTPECGWDGGDCCKSTCQKNAIEDCSAPMDCRDPLYAKHPDFKERVDTTKGYLSSQNIDESTNQTDGGEGTTTLQIPGESINSKADEIDDAFDLVAIAILGIFLGLTCFLKAERVTKRTCRRGGMFGNAAESYDDREGETLRNKLRLSVSTFSLSSRHLDDFAVEDDEELQHMPRASLKRSTSASSECSDTMAQIIDNPALWKEFQDRLRKNSRGAKVNTRDLLKEFATEKGLDTEEEEGIRFISLKPMSLLRSVSDSIASAPTRNPGRPRMGPRTKSLSAVRTANLYNPEKSFPEEGHKHRGTFINLAAAFSLDEDTEEDDDILPAL